WSLGAFAQRSRSAQSLSAVAQRSRSAQSLSAVAQRVTASLVVAVRSAHLPRVPEPVMFGVNKWPVAVRPRTDHQRARTSRNDTCERLLGTPGDQRAMVGGFSAVCLKSIRGRNVVQHRLAKTSFTQDSGESGRGNLFFHFFGFSQDFSWMFGDPCS